MREPITATADDVGTPRTKLEEQGWIYRGDAGDEGGHAFVLDLTRRHEDDQRSAPPGVARNSPN